MREGIHVGEDDIEGGEVIEALLEDVVGLREQGSINEGEAEVDMGLPTAVSRVMLDANGLDLLVVVLDCEG